MSAIRTSVLTGALALLGATTVPALHAQSAQRFSVQASGLAVSTLGEAYEGMNAGGGLEAQLRYTPGLWSFGLGWQLSTHSIEESNLGDDSVLLSGVFFEPRRTFDVGSSRFAPYASARLAYLRESVDPEVEGQSFNASASGTQLNVGGGMLLRVSPRVNVDLGATFGMINFGDLKLTVPGSGTMNLGSSGSGQNVVVRAGLSVGM